MRSRNQSRGLAKFFGLIVVITLFGTGIYVLTADSFEREAPKITIKDHDIWNLKGVFPIEIRDNLGVKHYEVALLDQGNRIPLETTMCQAESADPKSLCVGIQKLANASNDVKSLVLEVRARDKSYWNFFKGNLATQQFSIVIDTQEPELSVIANSYKITQGGSALVVFRAVDAHLQNLTISNGHLEFQAQPFYKEGFYIALIAWSKLHEDFTPKIIATDRAGNVSAIPIAYFQQKRQYRNSTISITDSFIDGKISALVEEIGARSLESFEDKVAIFRYINEEIRQESFERIFTTASTWPNDELIENFSIRSFAPLKNAAVTASFGDYRNFSYQGRIISQSHHMGLDLASIRQAPVILSNPGVVVLNEFVGINGKSIVVHHGLGLATLYSHLTTSDVALGDVLGANVKIANTGNTGLSLGDHLHFGVLVQGYEVWNAEWMDANWITLNITNVINKAKSAIDRI